jgi:hypothetical protein
VGFAVKVTEISFSKIYVKLKFVFVSEHHAMKIYGRLDLKMYALLITEKRKLHVLAVLTQK